MRVSSGSERKVDFWTLKAASIAAPACGAGWGFCAADGEATSEANARAKAASGDVGFMTCRGFHI